MRTWFKVLHIIVDLFFPPHIETRDYFGVFFFLKNESFQWEPNAAFWDWVFFGLRSSFSLIFLLPPLQNGEEIKSNMLPILRLLCLLGINSPIYTFYPQSINPDEETLFMQFPGKVVSKSQRSDWFVVADVLGRLLQRIKVGVEQIFIY